MNHDEREQERVRRACDEACEMLRDAGASTVHVMCSWETEDGGTQMYHVGRGNWYAQNGMMQYVLKKREASAGGDGDVGKCGPPDDE